MSQRKFFICLPAFALGFSISHAEEHSKYYSNSHTLPTIFVDARKREEDLNVIPIQVKHFDEWEIDNANIHNRNDIDLLDTSLSNIEPTGGIETRMLIRGVGGSFGIGEYSVGMFVDGVYQGADLYYGRDFVDLESIDILKGPQNTLYGKSTIGGAINIKTKDPEPEQYIKYSQHIGQRDFHRETLILNTPLYGEKLLSRLIFDYQDFDGFHSNPLTGSDRDDDRQKNLRAKLRWLPNQQLSFDASFSFRERDTESYTAKLVSDDNEYNSGSFALDSPHDVSIDSRQYSLTTTYETAAGYTLSSVSGYSNIKESDLVDIDYSALPPSAIDPFANIQAGRRVRGEDFSQELRITSPDKPWGNWLFGAYYFYLRDEFTQFIDLNTLTGASFPPSASFTSLTKSFTYSLFGEANFNLSEKNILGLGLRYDHDIRTFKDITETGFRDNEHFDAFSPRISLTHLFNDHVTLFATSSIGYKAGGFNPPGIAPFKEEKSTTIELGFKTEWSKYHFTFNGSVFHNRLEDQQIIEIDNISSAEFVGNSGKSRIQGLELETTWQPTSDWNFRGALTLLDTKFTDFTSNAINPDGMPGSFNLDGNELRYVEDYQASFTAAHDQAMPNGWLLTSRVDINAKGEKYWDNFNFYKQEPYEIVNLSFAFNRDDTQVSFYIDNLLNERYFSLLVPEFEFPFVNQPVAGLGPKRFIGFDVSHEF